MAESKPDESSPESMEPKHAEQPNAVSASDTPATAKVRPLVLEERHTLSLANAKKRRASVYSDDRMFIPKELARQEVHQAYVYYNQATKLSSCNDAMLKFTVIGGYARCVAEQMKKAEYNKRQHIAEEAVNSYTCTEDIKQELKDVLEQSTSQMAVRCLSANADDVVPDKDLSMPIFSTATSSAPPPQPQKIENMPTKKEEPVQHCTHIFGHDPVAMEMMQGQRSAADPDINVDLSAMTTFETALHMAQSETNKIDSVELLKNEKPISLPSQSAPPPPIAPPALPTPLQPYAEHSDEVHMPVFKVAQTINKLLEVQRVLSSDQNNNHCHNSLTLQEFGILLGHKSLFDALLCVNPMKTWIWHHLDNLMRFSPPAMLNTNQEELQQKQQQQAEQQQTEQQQAEQQQAEQQQQIELLKQQQQLEQHKQEQLEQQKEQQMRQQQQQQQAAQLQQFQQQQQQIPQQEIAQQQQHQILQQHQQQQLLQQQHLLQQQQHQYENFAFSTTQQQRGEQREQYLRRSMAFGMHTMQQQQRSSPLNHHQLPPFASIHRAQQPMPVASPEIPVLQNIAAFSQQQQQHLQQQHLQQQQFQLQHIETTLEQLADMQKSCQQQHDEMFAQFEESLSKIQADRVNCQRQLVEVQRSLESQLQKLKKDEGKLRTENTKLKQTFAEQLQKLGEAISQQTQRLNEQQLVSRSQHQRWQVNPQSIQIENRLHQGQYQQPQPQQQPLPLQLFNMQAPFLIPTQGAQLKAALEQPQQNNAQFLYQSQSPQPVPPQPYNTLEQPQLQHAPTPQLDEAQFMRPPLHQLPRPGRLATPHDNDFRHLLPPPPLYRPRLPYGVQNIGCSSMQFYPGENSAASPPAAETHRKSPKMMQRRHTIDHRASTQPYASATGNNQDARIAAAADLTNRHSQFTATASTGSQGATCAKKSLLAKYVTTFLQDKENE